MIGHEVEAEERNRIIGQNLRKYRLLKGLTQDELAEGLCSVSQLSKVENGKTYLKRTILKQLADRLGVTVEKVESNDAMLEELQEMLRIAKDARAARNYEAANRLVTDIKKQCGDFNYPEILAATILFECRLLDETRYYHQIIDLAERHMETPLFNKEDQKIELVYMLGLAYEKTGKMRLAIDCYRRAADMFETVEQDSSSATFMSTLFNLAKCNITQKNYLQGLRYAERAIEFAKLTNRHLYKLRMQYMMAHALNRLEKFEESEKLYINALAEAENNSFMNDVAFICNNYGEFLYERGEFARARSYFRRAKTTFELMRNNIHVFESYLYLSDLELLEGNTSSAIEYLNQVLSLTEEVGVSSYKAKAKALIRKGKICHSQGDLEQYIQLMEQGADIYEQLQLMDEAFEVDSDCADTLYEQGDPRAVLFYRKAVINQRKANGQRG